MDNTFELPHELLHFNSVSDIIYYINYIKRKDETSANNLPIHICINKINNRLVFKLKDGYKLKLQIIPEYKKNQKRQNKEWRKCTVF